MIQLFPTPTAGMHSRSASSLLISVLAAVCLLLASCSVKELDTDATDAFDLLKADQLKQNSPYIPIEGFVDTSAGAYHYVEMGEGPPLLLYHGFPSFWYAWKNVMPVLAPHFRVIAVDGLGANLSAKPAGLDPYKVEALAGQLTEVLDGLNVDEPVYLVGHDWGGALVWSFAQAYPERVAAMTAISAPPLNLFLELLETNEDQRKASAYVERIKGYLVSAELPPSAAERMTQFGYGTLLETELIREADYQAFGVAMAQPDALRATGSWYAANIPEPSTITDGDYWPSRTASASVPSLLIWGEGDTVFVPEFLGMASSYAEPLQVEVLPEAKHWPMFEARDRTNELLLDFFLGVARR